MSDEPGGVLGEVLAGTLDEPAGGPPLYRRIAEAIATGVADGRLAPGTRLPTHRALADDLGVAVPTVSRAYREAEQRGLVSSTVGRGTFVSGIPTLRDDEGPAGVLDLAVNAPARGEHAHLLRAALTAAAAAPAAAERLLGYASDLGGRADRELAAAWLARRGVDVPADRVALCAGGQHAILVALGTVLRPGDVLLAEALTYPGVRSAAQLLGVRVVGVEMDDDGLVPEALEARCAGDGPRALYCMPTAHNPTAITMPDDRRDALVAVARRHDLTIVEDDVFGLLAPRSPRPLAARAPERTLHLTSLSKTLAPGLRWGAVAVPGHLADRAGALVRATVFNPAPVALDVAGRWLADGTADRLLAWQRAEMAARFADATAHLRGCPAVRAVRTAGLHAWVELREPWTPDEVVDVARGLGVELGPTSFFHADAAAAAEPVSRGVRICLGNAPDRATLTTALAALAAALDRDPTWTSGTRV